MALDLKKLSSAVTIYGDSLYQEQTVLGTVAPNEYELDPESNTLKIAIGEGKFLYARIRQSVIEAGITDDQVFTIAEFVAKRDAHGVSDAGREWSVKAGDVRLFAM